MGRVYIPSGSESWTTGSSFSLRLLFLKEVLFEPVWISVETEAVLMCVLLGSVPADDAMTPMSLLLLLSLLVLLLSLAKTTEPTVEDLINRNMDFDAHLYRAVASRSDDNVVLSPFCLLAGMLALLSAANGPTRDQLLQGLFLNGLNPQTLPGRSGGGGQRPGDGD